MPTIITHSAVAIIAGKTFVPADVPRHFWILAIICSILPDADVIGFAFGIPYADFWGHRGFFHSIFFGLITGGLATVLMIYVIKPNSGSTLFYFLFFFLLSASHGLLDAFTNGGLGIALLSPFDNSRYFFPFTPVNVSPIGVRAFISQWGLNVMKSEIVWIWTPLLLVLGFKKAACHIRRRRV